MANMQRDDDSEAAQTPRDQPDALTVGPDLTERKQADEQLVLFRALIDQSHDAIEIVDPETGRILDVNAKACQVHGYTREEYLTLTVADIDPTVASRPWPETLESLRASGFLVLSGRHRRKDGSTFPVETGVNYVSLHRDYLLAVVRDVSERTRSEQRAAAQHALTQILVAAPSVAQAWEQILPALGGALDWEVGVLWHVDATAKVLRCDHVWHKPAFPPGEFAAVTRQMTFAPGTCSAGQVWSSGTALWCADIVHDGNFTRGAVAGGAGLHATICLPIMPGNAVFGVFEFFTTQVLPPDRALLKQMSDIASQIGQFIWRKQAEAELRKTGDLLHAVVEGTTDAVFVKDRAGRYLLFNGAAAGFVGRPAQEVLGHDDTTLFDADSLRQVMERDRAVMDTGQAATAEECLTAASVTRTYQATKAPYRDEHGNIIGVIGISRDITERKLLEDQLRQAQKMEAVGQLAGGVAHDFNNLLTVIIGFSQVLKAATADDDPNRHFIDEISKAGERAASLTRQLLAFSRKQLLVPVVLDLGALLNNMQKMLSRLIAEDIQLEFHVPPTALNIKADPGQTEQVIMNLIVNAGDAMPRGGKLMVATTAVELDAAYAQTHPGIEPGAYAALTVADTGCGMDAATQARIFEPFFTTKGPEKGTGLGLATVFGIVKQSGGNIDVRSAPGVGTTFTILLPRAIEELHRPKPRPIHDASRHGGETILLSEDDDGIRALMRLILVEHGYKVLEASNGLQALALCRRREVPIDILVSDVVMPNMSGPELARQAFSIRGTMKVLYLSGYTDDAVVRHGMIDADTPYLQKPFTPRGLLAKVREVLDTAPA